MTLANSVVAKLSVAFVALATAFVLAAPAQAQMTEDEMQGEIDRLTSLIEQLTSSLGGDTAVVTGGNTSSVCPYTWTRSLNMGATGMDVMKLQQFLNSNDLTRVAATGVGSAGMETEYYGPMTGAAVAKFQELNRDAILTPLGLVNSTTYFGPSTMAEANAQCASAPVVVDDTMDDDADDAADDDAADDDDDTDSKELGDGEGSINSIDEVSADESSLEEGKTQGLFAFTVEIEGDVEIDRLDVYLDSADADSESSNADDYFEGAELWVDGDKVADLDVSDFDEDEYGNVDVVTGDDDEYRLRFSGLGLVFEDGDEPEFQIALEAIGNVDGDDETETWGFDEPSFRFVDGEGFTDSYSDSSVEDTFGLDEEEMAELDITKSSESKSATTLEVDNDDDSEEHEIFVVNIEEQNGVDVTINEITMTASTTEGDVTSTIDEVILYVDGDEVGSDSPTAAGALTFDKLGIELDGEEDVDITAAVVFKGTDGYSEGDEVFLTFNAVTEAEDANGNDEDEITGSNPTDFDSDTFSLRSDGIALTLVDVTATEDTKTVSNSDVEYGTFVFEIEVMAFGDNFYMDEDEANVDYDVLVDGVALSALELAASSSAALDISGADDAVTADYKISKGDTVTLTFTVETATDISGTTKVRVNGVDYSAADDANEELTEDATPATDWTSSSLILN